MFFDDDKDINWLVKTNGLLMGQIQDLKKQLDEKEEDYKILIEDRDESEECGLIWKASAEK